MPVARICTHPWEFAVEPFRMVGNLYYVGNSDVSCHLVDTGDGLILIDTAFPQTVYLLLESIRRLGFDPRDIEYILHTHQHYDHSAGTPAMVGMTGAKTALGREDIPYVRERPEMTWAPEYGVEYYEEFDVDVPLDDGSVIELGNTRIECMASPGHTPGTMSYFFTVEEGGVQYVAGLFGGPGLNTLTDEYLAKTGRSASWRKTYMETLERLKMQHVDVRLGAHPNQNQTLEKHAARTPDANPYTNPEEWAEFLTDLERNARASWTV